MKYVVEARPLDGRFDGLSKITEAGIELAPIYDKFDVIVFPGGRFPSGHIERYESDGSEWHQESLPLDKGEAEAYLRSRLSRFAEHGSGKPESEDPPFEYRMVEYDGR